MPPNKKQWASWNGMRTQQKEFVTYWMNNLQKLDTEHEIFVSIGNFPNLKALFMKNSHMSILYLMKVPCRTATDKKYTGSE